MQQIRLIYIFCYVLWETTFFSGKTEFVLKLLRNDAFMFTTPFDRIIICYTVLQKKLSDFAEQDSRVTLFEGFDESLYATHDGLTHIGLVIDDCMGLDIYRELSKLWTTLSRHRFISCFFLTQNAFSRGSSSAQRYNRDILINR